MDLSLIDCQHDRKALRAELRARFAPISDDDSRFLGKINSASRIIMLMHTYQDHH
jgi:hypothetical protein